MRTPIHIEIGMGKGRFIMGMAGQHPEVNFIGIEKYSSVLLRAYRKWRKKSFPTYVLSVWMQRISAMYLIKRRSAGYT